MSEGWLSWLIIGAAGVLLIFNLLLLMRISDLQAEVDDLQPLNGNIIALQSDMRATETRLEELQREQEWVATRDWTIRDEGGEIDCTDDVPVQADWSFRKLSDDPEVRLDYRERGDTDWSPVEADATGDLDYRATFEVSLDRPLEHRIVAQSADNAQSSNPEPVRELSRLADRTLLFENGESRSQDGTRWTRFLVDNLSPEVSPCNEVVAAEIQVHDDDGEVVRSVEMERGYPGEHDPEGYDPGAGPGSGAATDDAAIGLEAGEVGAPTAWWTDWVKRIGDDDPVAVVEFRDGTTRTLDRMGTN